MAKTTRSELAHGAPGPLTIGDRTFLVSPPSLRDLQTIRSWVKKQLPTPLQAAIRDLAGLPVELREVAIREAVKANPGGADVTGEAMREHLISAPGCRFMTWVLCKKEQPDLTLKELEPLITEDNAADVFVALDEAAGLSALGKEQSPTG